MPGGSTNTGSRAPQAPEHVEFRNASIMRADSGRPAMTSKLSAVLPDLSPGIPHATSGSSGYKG